jgi:hypothetical protein
MKNLQVFIFLLLVSGLLQSQTLKTSVFSSGGGAAQTNSYLHFGTFGQPLSVGTVGMNYQCKEGFIFAQQNILTVTISANETICYNSPASILNSDYTGAEGELTYQWQVIYGANWVDITGEKYDTYDPGTLIETTQFRLVINDRSGNGQVISDPVTITVRNEFIPGEIKNIGETICYGGDPTEIGSATDASGGDETISYAWYSSTNYFADSNLIAGATQENYYPPSGLTQTTGYRRYAKDETCNTDLEAAEGTWTVVVREELTLTCPGDIEQNNDPGECSASVTFAATAGGTPNPTQTYKLGETSITSPYVFDVGTHTAVATATNDCGVVSCSFAVTVNDTEKPNVICQNITIDLDYTGNAVITPADIDNGSYDNCGIATMTLSRTEFGCADMGETYTVTLTVTDVNENVNTDQATVTVKELSVPSVRVNIRAANASNGQVKFTANPVNGGDNPTYKWYKNGEIIEGETGSELIATCKSGDEHWVVMQSSLPCTAPATSNAMCTY